MQTADHDWPSVTFSSHFGASPETYPPQSRTNETLDPGSMARIRFQRFGARRDPANARQASGPQPDGDHPPYAHLQRDPTGTLLDLAEAPPQGGLTLSGADAAFKALGGLGQLVILIVRTTSKGSNVLYIRV